MILTGEGPDAFCSGGDQRVRGARGGYVSGADPAQAGAHKAVGRFHVTDLHVQIRRMPKPVVAMVAGYAIGGGHVLHIVCDLTIAADNARFGQTGPKVGSFDGGFGASVLSRLVGPKKAKEIWFLCRQYDAQQALEMGIVNTVVPLDQLEAETVQWCREMLALSPFALRLLKASFNADEDGLSRDPAARPRRQPALLHERGGGRGTDRIPGEAQARLLAVPAPRLSGPRRAYLAHGVPGADAPGRDRAGARRHGAGRLFRRLPPAALYRGDDRRDLHPGRDATSQTTTPTPGAAPTPRTGLDRCA